MIYRKYLKRIIDFSVALIILAVIWPVLLLLALLLHIFNDGAGAFFLQERPGRNGKIFRVIKFKTMNDRCDENGVLLPDMKRITPIGNFVRKTSLDELPQLINVLIGDMSLIGPRPLLVQYLPLYSPKQARRHEVRPGITGWAQVHGRNNLSWCRRFEYDVWYVDNISLKVDIEILWLTVANVFRQDGINNASANSDVTMERFDGKN